MSLENRTGTLTAFILYHNLWVRSSIYLLPSDVRYHKRADQHKVSPKVLDKVPLAFSEAAVPPTPVLLLGLSSKERLIGDK